METAIAIPQEKKSGLNDTDKFLIRVGAYTLGTMALSTTLFFVGRKIYRNAKQQTSAKKILTDDSPENYAERLRKALFDGWWADVDTVREVFTEIPSLQVFNATATAYQNVAEVKKNQLFLDLAKKLTVQEFSEIQNILASKPAKTGQKTSFDMKAATAMARRIKSAFDYTWMGIDGTNKPALKEALLEIPSLTTFAMVMVAYKNQYHTNLTVDIDSELDSIDFSWKDIVYTKPKK